MHRFIAYLGVSSVLVASSPSTLATIVRFNSVLGSIDVRLYDTATPLTSANFLDYANAGDYTDTFIHRSMPGFVVQGGGFTFPSNDVGVEDVPQRDQVMNEPGISNLRGTIAMAKLAAPEDGGPPNGGPDSATNQWFFSLADNSQNLDNQNGGFTVFGRVVGAGMTVVDEIAALPRVNAGSPYNNLPVRDFLGGTILKENLVTFSSISTLNLPDGDYNFDGVVDGADLLIWQADFGSTTRAEADGNGDGEVNQADLVVWRNNYGAAASAAISAAPEPSAAVLALVASGLLVFARRRRRQG